jgi:hypothetical protein
VRALVLAALLLAAPVAMAEPHPDTDCIGGNYNPNALSNVCYQQGSTGGSPPGTGHTGTVGTNPTEVCVIGNTCEDVPVPYYTPNGGVSYPYPGTPGTPTAQHLYVEVLGSEVGSGEPFCVPSSVPACVDVCTNQVDSETCVAVIVNNRSTLAVGTYTEEDWQTGETRNCYWVSVGQGTARVSYDSCNPIET